MARFYEVFPDVLPDFQINVNLLVEFGPGRWDMVYRGNFLSKDQVEAVPRVTFPMDGLNKKGADQLWTLALVDSGNPESQGAEQRLHWLMTNIEAGDRVSEGNCVVPYETGYPTKADGAHKYIFALLRQNGPLHPDIPNTPFSLASFMAEKQLTAYGLAFYQAECDYSDSEVVEAAEQEEGSRQSKYSELLM